MSENRRGGIFLTHTVGLPVSWPSAVARPALSWHHDLKVKVKG